MSHNKYDEEIFFKKYSEMSRSKLGLEGAGEWETLKSILPDFKGKTVLDLGCGYGWHCRYAIEQGAKTVIGIDSSKRMLDIARGKTPFPEVQYQYRDILDVDFPDDNFDIILSSLVLHYVDDLESVIKNVYRMLKAGGSFIFSVEHPVFTAFGSQDWYYDEKGEIMHFPVDNYYYEGKREAIFLGEKMTKYHRTLTSYFQFLLASGFKIRHCIEPKPPTHMLDIPGMKDEMRRPMMLIISVEK